MPLDVPDEDTRVVFEHGFSVGKIGGESDGNVVQDVGSGKMLLF